ncbi:type II secretion system F family protein [uncultured Amnibacterium sp.]|uniref:type II secretion system F family protein n=1 Tax=uncultured Amnibacterium sp. TaxID=1631851 RepID=UPI0035C9C3A9
MTPSIAWAVACGVGIGLGLWSLVSLFPRFAQPRLAARVAPSLLDVSAEARRFTYRPSVDPLPIVGVLVEPALRAFQTVFGGVLGVAGRTAYALRRAGDERSVEAHRLRQMLWTVGGAAAGGAAAVAVGLAHGPAATAIALPVLGAGAGLLGLNALLTRAGTRRVARIESELPTVLEFLALSVSAGESIHDALRRVAGVASGALAEEFRRVTAEVAVGVPLAVALARVADELRIPALTRSLAHIVAALDRGTPLAELLRAQAGDARDEARRGLIEAAGRKEIAMLVPLVFLILPVTIAFAVFPGLLVLQTQL